MQPGPSQVKPEVERRIRDGCSEVELGYIHKGIEKLENKTYLQGITIVDNLLPCSPDK